MRKTIRKRGCEHPERLKGKPEECGFEQIRKCHGDIPTEKHPCVPKRKRRTRLFLKTYPGI